MKKVVYDDTCKFCTGIVSKVFDDKYELVGSSKLSKEDSEKLKDYNLSKEIVMINENGSVSQNIDVFLDTKQNGFLHKIANIRPVHYSLRQAYKLIVKIRYRLK